MDDGCFHFLSRPHTKARYLISCRPLPIGELRFPPSNLGLTNVILFTIHVPLCTSMFYSLDCFDYSFTHAFRSRSPICFRLGSALLFVYITFTFPLLVCAVLLLGLVSRDMCIICSGNDETGNEGGCSADSVGWL